MLSQQNPIAWLAGLAILGIALSAAEARARLPAEMSPAAPAEARQPENEDYSDEIVWFDDRPTLAVFVPQRVLAGTALEELPVTDSAREKLRYAMRFPEDRRRHDFPNQCLYEPDLGGPVREELRVTVEEWIASRTLAFVGHVVDTVPGWSAWEGRPVTMVYVRVEEILQNSGDVLGLGHTLAYSRNDATIDLYGVEACSKLPAEVELAHVGDRILFTGSRFEHHPLFLVRNYVFPVRGDQVLPLRWTRRIKTAGPTPLELIRSSIRPEEQH